MGEWKMVDIDRSSLDEASRSPARAGFLRAIGGPQFIVAQMFTIAATVLGVYLAGYVGFQRTLEYDRLVKAQQQSELLQAMHSELKDNTTRMREFATELDPTGATATYAWPALRLYVWTAAGRTQAVFETPPQTLTGMQAFYEQVGSMLGNSQAHEWFRRSTGTYAFDRNTFKTRFEDQIRFSEETLLPTIERAAADAAQRAADYADGGA
jgi:hypothetical protein